VEALMDRHAITDRQALDGIRAALHGAREAARRAQLDGCDLDDLELVLAPAEAELDANLPNVQTLATYLNSVARSLRAVPSARNEILQLDAAMRAAHIPTQWEH
jgi:hypothetical protein